MTHGNLNVDHCVDWQRHFDFGGRVEHPSLDWVFGALTAALHTLRSTFCPPGVTTSTGAPGSASGGKSSAGSKGPGGSSVGHGTGPPSGSGCGQGCPPQLHIVLEDAALGMLAALYSREDRYKTYLQSTNRTGSLPSVLSNRAVAHTVKLAAPLHMLNTALRKVMFPVLQAAGLSPEVALAPDKLRALCTFSAVRPVPCLPSDLEGPAAGPVPVPAAPGPPTYLPGFLEHHCTQLVRSWLPELWGTSTRNPASPQHQVFRTLTWDTVQTLSGFEVLSVLFNPSFNMKFAGNGAHWRAPGLAPGSLAASPAAAPGFPSGSGQTGTARRAPGPLVPKMTRAALALGAQLRGACRGCSTAAA